MDPTLECSSTLVASDICEPVRLTPRPPRRRSRVRLRLGIVNNMPDAALVATERQFTHLVRAALDDTTDIRLFHIPSLSRGEKARKHLARHYRPVSSLYGSRFDAIIVTGNEPRAARIDDEPYWPEMAQLVDWARDYTGSTLWSCLAAHAAVLRLDGIERRRLPQKKSGLLSCKVSATGTDHLPDSLSVCHSRLNELPKGELLAHGYKIVSEADGGHVDVFTKAFRSSFVFLQGHPEYESDSLMREYRRDVGRYLRGEQEAYPEVPENYFDNDTVLRLENYRTLAERTRDPELFETFPAVCLRPGLEARLQNSAAAVFDYWMSRVAAVCSAA